MAKINTKLPSISRIIHDKNYVSIIVGSLFILLAIALVSVDLRKSYIQNREEIASKNNLIVQEIFWGQTMSKYSDYRDGYLALAQVEYKLGDSNESLSLVKKALDIDPNYKDAIDFERFLEAN